MAIADLEKFMNKVLEDTNISFVVAYSKKEAEAVLIAPGLDSEINKEDLHDPVHMSEMNPPLCKETYLQLKSTTIFSAYGSPGCQLVRLPNGTYKKVTWPQ